MAFGKVSLDFLHIQGALSAGEVCTEQEKQSFCREQLWYKMGIEAEGKIAPFAEEGHTPLTLNGERRIPLLIQDIFHSSECQLMWDFVGFFSFLNRASCRDHGWICFLPGFNFSYFPLV